MTDPRKILANRAHVNRKLLAGCFCEPEPEPETWYYETRTEAGVLASTGRGDVLDGVRLLTNGSMRPGEALIVVRDGAVSLGLGRTARERGRRPRGGVGLVGGIDIVDPGTPDPPDPEEPPPPPTGGFVQGQWLPAVGGSGYSGYGELFEDPTEPGGPPPTFGNSADILPAAGQDQARIITSDFNVGSNSRARSVLLYRSQGLQQAQLIATWLGDRTAAEVADSPPSAELALLYIRSRTTDSQDGGGLTVRPSNAIGYLFTRTIDGNILSYGQAESGVLNLIESSDGGLTWQEYPTSLDPNEFNSDWRYGGTATATILTSGLVGWPLKIHRSTDGINWDVQEEFADFAPDGIEVSGEAAPLAVVPGGAGHWAIPISEAFSGTQILISTDDGETWELESPPIDFFAQPDTIVSLDWSGTDLFVLMSTGNAWKRAGGTWTQLLNLPTNSGAFPLSIHAALDEVLVVWSDWVNNPDAYRSRDGGETWTGVNIAG